MTSTQKEKTIPALPREDTGRTANICKCGPVKIRTNGIRETAHCEKCEACMNASHIPGEYKEKAGE